MGYGGSYSGSSYTGAQQGTGNQKFDTGLFRAQRSAVRESIAARLAPLLKANGRYVRKIGNLPRPLKGHDEEELGFLANEVQGNAPCIVVALGRKEYQSAGMDIPATQFRGELEVAIYVASANSRAFVEGRLAQDVPAMSDATADPGIETMLEHIEELLIGQMIDLKGTADMRPISEDEVFTGGDYSVWEQRYTLLVDRFLNPERLNTKILTSIEGANNLDGADPGNPVVDTVSTLEIA